MWGCVKNHLLRVFVKPQNKKQIIDHPEPHKKIRGRRKNDETILV